MRKLLFLFLAFVGAVFCQEIRPSTTVKIPMQDGKELATDIYLPSPGAKNLPTLLVRSPPGRQAEPALAALALLKEGYAIAIQETRSAADPEGKTMPCLDDAKDGADTVAWLAKAEFSNGKVGTFGRSALGIAQLLMAPGSPDSLKAQYIEFACGSIYHHAAYPQGQFHKHQIESWLGYYAKDPIHTETLKRERHYSSFWRRFDSIPKAHQVTVPAVFVAGWFDTFLSGTLEAFDTRQKQGGEGAKGEQKLIIGPWTHFWPSDKTLGDYEVPKVGQQPPVNLSAEKWFAHYLKGEDNGIEKTAPVTYYVMGPFDGSRSKGNVWKTAKSWPVPSEPVSFYLTANQGLSTDEQKGSYHYSFDYDPDHPVPTVGGRNLFIPSGPKDQSEIEARKDVLVFTTAPLKEDLEVTGNLKAKIFFSTDADDTDLAVRLTDVYPDGKSLLISDNAVRLASLFHDRRSVSSRDHPEPHEVEVDLHSTSLVFAKGHKIRLSITSSNYPRFEKNLNTRLDDEGHHTLPHKVAKNTVWTGTPTLSRLILPVVK
jgi:hypothetical protein